MLEEKKKRTHVNIWIVEECRGCGRSYTVRAPIAAGSSSPARTKCAECGATNATHEHVATPEQVSEVLEDA